MANSKNGTGDEFKKGLAKGAGYALGAAVVCGTIGFLLAGPAGAVVGAKAGAAAGGGGGAIS